MTRTVSLVIPALLVAAGVLAAPQEGEEPSAAPTAAVQTTSDEDDASQDSLEALEQLTVPGEPHELLAGTVGDWDLTIRVWSAPEREPQETRGTASGRWILGERFVETTYSGEVMGREFEGLKIEGFENASKEYVSTWRDNLGTYTLLFRGTCGTDCSVRTMLAEFVDPVSKQNLRIKGVTTISDGDGYTYESFVVTPDGGEFKNMELVAERRQP